jgi:ATP-binding cassette subfamily B protein
LSLSEFLRTLRRHLAPHRAEVAGIVGAVTADVAFKIAWPLSFRVLIDQAVAGHDRSLLWSCLAALAGGVVAVTAAALLRDGLFARTAASVAHEIRTGLFDHLQRLSIGFHARARSADLLTRFSADLAAAEMALTWVSASLFLNLLNVLVSASVLLALDARLAAASLVGLAACALAPRSIAARVTRAGMEKKRWDSELAQMAQENLATQPAVKAFGLQELAVAEFQAHSAQAVAPARRFFFLTHVMERAPNALILATEVVVIGTGILLVFRGELTVGAIVAFQALFLNLASSVDGLASVLPVLFQALPGVQRIEELRGVPADEPRDPTEDVPRALSAGAALELRGVTFGYGEHPVLQELDLSVPAGTHVALVGGSGSGKSTVIALLLRFHEAQHGSIAFNGRVVRDLPRATLRARMGVVFQESVLLDRSIRENIRLGRPGASDADVEAAARAADLHDPVIAMPEGYDTRVGDRGGRLSGGQRQRVAIARALLREPDLLLLDEATSALDPATEEAVNRTLRRVAHGRTVVTVTHRLASITDADQIVVLQAGRIAERGRHEELLARAGVYASLWQKQTGFSYDASAERVDVRAGFLRRYPVLCELELPLLEQLATRFTTELHPPGRVVVQEGDPGDRFYVIVRGRLGVSHGEAELPEAVLEDGDHFGEVALLRDVPRTATVRTLGHSVLLSLQRHHFQELVRRAPAVLERLLRPRGRAVTG